MSVTEAVKDFRKILKYAALGSIITLCANYVGWIIERHYLSEQMGPFCSKEGHILSMGLFGILALIMLAPFLLAAYFLKKPMLLFSLLTALGISTACAVFGYFSWLWQVGQMLQPDQSNPNASNGTHICEYSEKNAG